MTELTKQELERRGQIEALESSLMDRSEELGLVIGDSEMFPLKHTFVNGLYIREMSMPKNHFAIGKLQKHEHLWMLLQGKLTVTTQSGSEEYVAPCYVKASPGEKKAVYAHEDSVFANIYPNPNNCTDLDEIENTWIAKDYAEYFEYKQLKE
jgi:hypothetical protein